MNVMRVRELRACQKHNRALVILEAVESPRRVTFYAEAEDARRLARELTRGPRACHPIFDFVMSLLRNWHATPVHIVLEDAEGDGIVAFVCVRQGEIEAKISCYPPDALTLALRTGVPIYATAGVLEHSEIVGEDPVTAQWLENVRPVDFQPRHGGRLDRGE